MRFSLLHLSDLHRDLDEEVETAALLDSLERDCERYEVEKPRIERPALCVVTGDMIFGVSATGQPTELDRQYDQSLEFLSGLAERFFNGLRERVVILPGNHDVSFPAFRSCVQRLETPTDDQAKSRLVKELFAPLSRLRWSWPELCFYRITDEVAYLKRLEHFAKLYSSFYQGKRSFALEPENQRDIFDFTDLNFCVVSLSSCYNNDAYRRAGAFHPTATTEACKSARSPNRAGQLIAAAWHHNVSGGPTQDDYLDNGALQLFIDSGISIGLHGHQHLTDCVDERYRVGPNPRKITIVSAGTLCAGPHHLAPGAPRSFNIVELDTSTWMGRVHQRNMLNRTYSLPLWGPGHFTATNRSYIDFSICPPLSTRPAQLTLSLTLERAADLLGSRSWDDAFELLRPHAAIPIARPLLARALSEIGDSRRTIDTLSPPTTIAEAVLVGGEIYSGGTKLDAEAFLTSPFVVSSRDASVAEIASRVRGKRTP